MEHDYKYMLEILKICPHKCVPHSCAPLYFYLERMSADDYPSKLLVRLQMNTFIAKSFLLSKCSAKDAPTLGF